MNEHCAGRATGGEPGVASRALLILLGLLGFVLSPAVAVPHTSAGPAQGTAQHTVSLKKTVGHGTSRSSRGSRGSARAALTGTHAEAAGATAPAASAPLPGWTPGLLTHDLVPAAPPHSVGAISDHVLPVPGSRAGPPRGRAPPLSTGF